ncbi:MAG: hypothetical protein K2G16_04365 [Lachnospiraceae bacterium]|nr:hypothetical protein [Lachnospiraceae bacterium]
MRNIDENKKSLLKDDEAERLYQIYKIVQSGNKTVLNELFQTVDSSKVCNADKMNEEYRLSHMDNVLDSELILDSRKCRQEKEWLNSIHAKVIFQFPCLNKMLYKKKKYFLSNAKNTGYENGKKIRNGGHSKFYEGKYDISDFDELMYETVIEIFSGKADENNCLTLDNKKNTKPPICDGESLLKNISYFTSRKINKRAKESYLDILEAEYFDEEQDIEFSYFDKYIFEKYLEAEGESSRLWMYAEYLEWLKSFDVHKLFKTNASDIRAIIETIMNCKETFIPNVSGDNETGFGMRLVKQEMLQKIIKSGFNIDIKQENISKNMEIIEQRLLNHLLYSLNYKIDKAAESKGIYEKESERFLYVADKKSYVKMFSRASCKIYKESSRFLNSNMSNLHFEGYFRIVKKYEDMIMNIVSSEKGKMKYDMVNVISENDDDLVNDKREALFHIAKTVISYSQKKEEAYKRNELGEFKISGLIDWEKGYWEAELEGEFLNMKLWTNKSVKNPIRRKINKEKLMVYDGFMNYFFCDIENKIGYAVPKNRRVISKSNKKHEVIMYSTG